MTAGALLAFDILRTQLRDMLNQVPTVIQGEQVFRDLHDTY